jgi:hypothetical protein
VHTGVYRNIIAKPEHIMIHDNGKAIKQGRQAHIMPSAKIPQLKVFSERAWNVSMLVYINTASKEKHQVDKGSAACTQKQLQTCVKLQ